MDVRDRPPPARQHYQGRQVTNREVAVHVSAHCGFYARFRLPLIILSFLAKIEIRYFFAKLSPSVSYFDGVSFSRQNTTRADRSLTGRWQGTCLRTASSVRDFFCNTISEDSCFIWNYGISPSLRSSVLSISFFDVVSVLDAISFIWVRPGETIHNKNKYHNKY